MEATVARIDGAERVLMIRICRWSYKIQERKNLQPALSASLKFPIDTAVLFNVAKRRATAQS
jgi:hypothetical protein